MAINFEKSHSSNESSFFEINNLFKDNTQALKTKQTCSKKHKHFQATKQTFSKLKNFLLTMDDFIIIENSGTNHALAKLKKYILYSFNNFYQKF